jgi:hypothetical protein
MRDTSGRPFPYRRGGPCGRPQPAGRHAPGGSATPALLAQPSPTCFAIIDQALLNRMSVSDPYYARGGERLPGRIEELMAESPYIACGETPAALARAAGIAEEPFAATVREWNALLASGAAADP